MLTSHLLALASTWNLPLTNCSQAPSYTQLDTSATRLRLGLSSCICSTAWWTHALDTFASSKVHHTRFSKGRLSCGVEPCSTWDSSLLSAFSHIFEHTRATSCTWRAMPAYGSCCDSTRCSIDLVNAWWDRFIAYMETHSRWRSFACF